MPKAPRPKRFVQAPYQRESDEQMDAMEGADIEFKPSVLAKKSTTPSRRSAFLDPSDPSPHDGMTQEESEDALLAAVLPTLPKKGLSAPNKSGSRGALVRQQRLEVREMRDQIRKLKDTRMRTGSNARVKGQKKSITQEIKSLEDELTKKHEAELAQFDAQNEQADSSSSSRVKGKINFKSINLDFSHIKFNASDSS